MPCRWWKNWQRRELPCCWRNWLLRTPWYLARKKGWANNGVFPMNNNEVGRRLTPHLVVCLGGLKALDNWWDKKGTYEKIGRIQLIRKFTPIEYYYNSTLTDKMTNIFLWSASRILFNYSTWRYSTSGASPLSLVSHMYLVGTHLTTYASVLPHERSHRINPHFAVPRW